MGNMFDKYTNVEVSLKFPYSSEDSRFSNYISIFVFTLLTPLIVPIFVLLGYNVELRSAVLNKDDTPPSFSEYHNLIKEGYRMFVSYLPLLSFSLILLIAALIYVPLAGLSLLPLFLLPAVSVRYAQTREYSSVYDDKLFQIVSDKDYARAWFVYILHFSVACGVIFTFTLLTFGVGLFACIPYIVTYRSVYWSNRISNLNID